MVNFVNCLFVFAVLFNKNMSDDFDDFFGAPLANNVTKKTILTASESSKYINCCANKFDRRGRATSSRMARRHARYKITTRFASYEQVVELKFFARGIS